MDLFSRLSKLAKRNHERFIILNEAGDDGFVMLPLSEYEALGTQPKEEQGFECSPMPEMPEHEHILVPPPVQDEIKIKIKLGTPQPTSKISQKFEDEEKFYLEPLG